MLVCECGNELDGETRYEHGADEESGTAEHPICFECGSTNIKWKPLLFYRTVDAVFDYYFQVYRNAAGQVVDVYYAVHSCPRCNGPARELYSNAYYERCECANCGHGFSVK